MSSQRLIAIISGLMSNAPMQHYHTKLMMKHAHTGGAHEWHQDYGYWYHNGLLFPDLITAFIAVDECSKANGCLNVLTGSHNMGRIDHLKVGGQTAADPERVALAEQVCETHAVELRPGDTLFFHCNLLHRSGPNESANSRRALLAAYNKKSNRCHREHHHVLTDIEERIADDRIKTMGVVPTTDENIFMDPKRDATVSAK